MISGALDAAVIRRHLLALDTAVETLRRHTGRPAAIEEYLARVAQGTSL